MEGYWGERYKYAEFEGGKYLEPSFLPFANIFSLEYLDRSHFPTADWFDYSTIRQQCLNLADQNSAICFGTAGDMDFINSIARARGTEQVFIDFEIFEKHFAPKLKKYFEMVHSYGAKTMMHMCGCVRALLPRLIELGLDV
jgi:uroporphyrinogen decarboxylase